MKNYNMLYIGSAFPPLLAPESLLVARTIPKLVNLGWQIKALTVNPDSIACDQDSNLLQLIPESVDVIRTASIDKLLLRIPIMRYLLIGILLMIGMPEIMFLWYFTAVNAGKRLIRRHPFDIIYSRACSFTSNVIALMIKRTNDLPWVAHFSDPWVDSPYFRGTWLQKLISTRLERAIISEADAVVFVTQQTADLVMRKYPSEWRTKVHIIPHGYDKMMLSCDENKSLTEINSRMKMVYTGSFIPGKRTPETFLMALHQLNLKLPLQDLMDVVLVGPIIDTYPRMAKRLNLGRIVTFTGAKPYLDSIKITTQADVLLIIDAKSDVESVFLPSKIVDYMMVEKPILGLTPKSGASAELLDRLGCLVVDPSDVSAVEDAIKNLLHDWQRNELKISPNYQKVASEYEISRTCLKLHHVLESTAKITVTHEKNGLACTT